MTNLCAGYSDSLYRNRLQALLGVDAMVEAVADYLLVAGKLDSTFFVYTSDHGPAASPPLFFCFWTSFEFLTQITLGSALGFFLGGGTCSSVPAATATPSRHPQPPPTMQWGPYRVQPNHTKKTPPSPIAPVLIGWIPVGAGRCLCSNLMKFEFFRVPPWADVHAVLQVPAVRHRYQGPLHGARAGGRSGEQDPSNRAQRRHRPDHRRALPHLAVTTGLGFFLFFFLPLLPTHGPRRGFVILSRPRFLRADWTPCVRRRVACFRDFTSSSGPQHR